MTDAALFRFIDQDIDRMADEVQSWMDEAHGDQQGEFIQTKESDLVIYHNTLGRKIRNHFELWNIKWDPVLVKKGGIEVDDSPDHPDSVSMRVIETLWRRHQKEN